MSRRLLFILWSGLILLWTACSTPPSGDANNPTSIPPTQFSAGPAGLLYGRPANFHDVQTHTSLWAHIQVTAQTAPASDTYSTQVKATDTLEFTWGWCAASESILQEDVKHMILKFFVNQQAIDDSQVLQYEYTGSNAMSCQGKAVFVTGWKAGVTYTFTSQHTFQSSINDGYSDYPPGDYIHNLKVTVQ